MPVEGLNNIYGIPPVKKEREAGQDSRKRKDKERARKNHDEKKKKKEPGGRIDIRI